jgi:hypothetical protein
MFEKIKKIIQGKEKKARSPTLDTIIMIENFIKENSGRYNKTQIFKNLPKKVMWQTYRAAMSYLEESCKIAYEEKMVKYSWNPQIYKYALMASRTE